MKKIIILFGILGFLACNKEDEGIEMKHKDLVGTYWKQTQYVRYNYQNGEQTDKFVNNFDKNVVGGPGPTILYFQKNNWLVEYHTMSPTGDFPSQYYKARSFDYSSDAGSFIIYEQGPNENRNYVLETFTSKKLVWGSTLEYVDNGAPCVEKIQETYLRYTPTDEWKRKVVQYPNYDDIDWTNPR